MNRIRSSFPSHLGACREKSIRCCPAGISVRGVCCGASYSQPHQHSDRREPVGDAARQCASARASAVRSRNRPRIDADGPGEVGSPAQRRPAAGAHAIPERRADSRVAGLPPVAHAGAIRFAVWHLGRGPGARHGLAASARVQNRKGPGIPQCDRILGEFRPGAERVPHCDARVLGQWRNARGQRGRSADSRGARAGGFRRGTTE